MDTQRAAIRAAQAEMIENRRAETVRAAQRHMLRQRRRATQSHYSQELSAARHERAGDALDAATGQGRR